MVIALFLYIVFCICKWYIGSDDEIWVKRKSLFESWLHHLQLCEFEIIQFIKF